MKRLFFVSLGLLIVSQISLSEASRSLTTGTQRSLPKTTPVPDSRLLETAYPIKKGSATERLSRAIIRLEKAIEGIKPTEKVSAEKAKEVKTIVSDIFDLDRLGKQSLINHWDELGKTKKGLSLRTKYTRLFRDLVEENYLEKARKYIGGNYRIPLIEEKTNARGTVIIGRIQKTDVDVELEFRFQQTAEGLKVTDILLDQTSLEGTYRSSFSRIIRKKGGGETGMSELLAVMEKRLQDLKAGRAATL